MRKKGFRKRILSCIIAAGLLASLTACGKEYAHHEKGVANTDTSQTDFSIMGGIGALSTPYSEKTVLNELQEETGIHINWNTISESIAEQVNIRIAGGELPDAFIAVGFNNFDISRYGDDGTFIDLSPYLTEEYMPNLTRILEENPDIKRAITMDDGYIYGLPVPTTLDELHTALKAFQDNDMSATYYGNAPGSTIPMSTGFDQWCWGQNIFYAGFGFTNWPNDVCNDLVLNDDGKVEFVCTKDEYRDALTYFHDWYAEGLMDVEMFSQDDT